MNILKNEIYENFNQLIILSKSNEISEKTLFKEIGLLDKKYLKIDPDYEIDVNGLINDIACTTKKNSFLNDAMKRLKRLLEKGDLLSEEQKNKIHFLIGNNYYYKFQINNSDPYSINNLISNNDLNEARKYFSKVTEKSPNEFISSNINQANILDTMGRNYESIILLNKVLKIDPSSGIALGNKAIALFYYFRLMPEKNTFILFEIKRLLEKALLEKTTIDYDYIDFLKKELIKIESIILDYKIKPDFIPKNNLNNDKYINFVLEHNLFLNFDFGYYFDKTSLIDNLTPILVSEKEDFENIDNEKYNTFPKNIYYTIKLLNQIYESFTTARLLYFQFFNNDYTKLDKKILYLSTLEYASNSTKYGLIKIVIAQLFNILDKIAHLIYSYFKIDKEGEIYFSTLLSDPRFKNLIENNKNFQLLALYSLSKDFDSEQILHKFKRLRNLITHEFIDIVEIYKNDLNYEKYHKHHFTEDEINDATLNLFSIIKSAIFYFVLAVEQKNRSNFNTDNLGTLYLKPQ